MTANPERRAWRILLASFIAFALLCSGTIYLVQWYLFGSTVELDANLIATRGTVQAAPPGASETIAVTDQRSDLPAGTTIQTDSTSQAAITFHDERTGEVLATVILFRDGQVTIRDARAPRFQFGRAPITIVLDDLNGRANAVTSSTTTGHVQLRFDTPHASASSSQAGDYLIESSESTTAVDVREGLAWLTVPGSSTRTVLASGQGIVVGPAYSQPAIVSLEASLIPDGGFEEPFSTNWEAYNDLETDPPGTVYNMNADGRTVVVFDRGQSNWPDLRLGHGETGLTQELDADVSLYSYVAVEATFLIDEQSLSTCGERGSECPMMLRLDYLDENGVEHAYITGFYSIHNQSLGYPLACDTCRTDHERISLGSWYTYESGNLMERLPLELRPARIEAVRLYASGHAYRTLVSDVKLLVSP